MTGSLRVLRRIPQCERSRTTPFFDADTAALAWTPTDAQVGSHWLSFGVLGALFGLLPVTGCTERAG